MKKWPANTQPESFDNLSRPLKAFFRRAFTIRDKPGVVKYTAHSGGTQFAAFAAKLDYHFTPEGVEYNREQGRDRLDCAINAAIQVGIEQGRRIEIEKHKRNLDWAIRVIERNDVDSLPVARQLLATIQESWKK